MNEPENLNNTVAELKANILKTQPFKVIYAAANWVVKTIAKALGGTK